MAPLDIIALHDETSSFYHEEESTVCIKLLTTPQQKKSVSFAATDTIHKIIQRSDYSHEEIESTWYSFFEMRSMKDEARCLVTRMNNEEFTESNEFTSRGLESRTMTAQREKRQNRSRAYATVFMEQEMQQAEGMSDADLLADFYFDCTQQCAVAAHMTALRDEQAAKEIAEEDLSNSNNTNVDDLSEHSLDDDECDAILNEQSLSSSSFSSTGSCFEYISIQQQQGMHETSDELRIRKISSNAA